MNNPINSALYQSITQSATEHAASTAEADMEVGDLQEALELVINKLTPDQVSEIIADRSPAISNLIETYGDGFENLSIEVIENNPGDVSSLNERQVLNIVQEGMSIEVAEPTENSSYTNAFEGIVSKVSIDKKLITVRDGDDCHFDIDVSEIESIHP